MRPSDKKGAKTFVDRSVPTNTFTIGKVVKKWARCNVFTSIPAIFKHHGNLLGFGAWTVLLCEMTGPEKPTLKPTKNLGTFVSGGLRGGERYGTISKAKNDAELVKLTKGSSR